jgi:hypothetical protein
MEATLIICGVLAAVAVMPCSLAHATTETSSAEISDLRREDSPSRE